jgi:nucleoside-diphosphate-sugar epimerase
MRVLLCGAGGFLGQAVVEVLAREHALRLFDARPLESPHEQVTGDVADYAVVERAVDGCEAIVDVIMAHESAYAGAATQAFDTNVRGLYTLLEAARCKGVRQVVHMSTGSVFTGHPFTTMRLTNDMPMRTESPYGLTKILQEDICRYFADRHGMAITVFRPWGIHDVRLGLTKYGPAECKGWHVIDRYDVAEAVALAVSRPGSGLRAYLLPGNAEARELMEWESLERDLGWRPART